MQSPPARNKVVSVRVMFNVRDCLGWDSCAAISRKAEWVVEMTGGVAKGVNLHLGEQILRELLQKPVQNQTTLHSALGVQEENDLGVARVVELGFDDAIADADVTGRVAEVALDETFEDVKEEARSGCGWLMSDDGLERRRGEGGALRFVVDAEDGTLEGGGEAIDVGLHPVGSWND